MYEFIDTTEFSDSVSLPSEALKINGEYIENQVTGYRTLYASGRESFVKELEIYDSGIRDGSMIKNRRYPVRTIVVGFQLIAKTNKAFRTAFNKLNSILNVEEAELIFHDEEDKFFVGTPSSAGKVPAGRNSIVSEFEITCVDPFKYSVEEKELTVSLNENGMFSFNYDGTYKAYPVLEADIKSDLGFVGFVNEKEAVIQVGDTAETDEEVYYANKMMVDDNFNMLKISSRDAWKSNIATTVTVKNEHAQNGTPGMVVDEDSISIQSATAWGSGNEWHGASVTRVLDETPSNCKLEWQQLFVASSAKQMGCMQILLTTTNDSGGKENVAAVSVFKGSTSSKKAKAYLYVRGKKKKEIEFVADSDSKTAGYYNGKCSIEINNGSYTFLIAGKKYTIQNLASGNTQVNEISLYFGSWKSTAKMNKNGIYYVKFRGKVLATRDTANTFSDGDKVVIDCKNGTIELNGIDTPSLGVIGNDWEKFCLTPGVNTIACTYSDWENAVCPDFRIRYREVFV